MGQIKFYAALVFITLFTLAIVGYSIGFANDNGAVVSLDPDSELAGLSSTAQSNINTFSGETNTSTAAFMESTITGADQTTVTGGEFKGGLGTLLGTINAIIKTTRKTLFEDSPAFGVILTALSAFLMFMGTKYMWKTWKGGNPD